MRGQGEKKKRRGDPLPDGEHKRVDPGKKAQKVGVQGPEKGGPQEGEGPEARSQGALHGQKGAPSRPQDRSDQKPQGQRLPEEDDGQNDRQDPLGIHQETSRRRPGAGEPPDKEGRSDNPSDQDRSPQSQAGPQGEARKVRKGPGTLRGEPQGTDEAHQGSQGGAPVEEPGEKKRRIAGGEDLGKGGRQGKEQGRQDRPEGREHRNSLEKGLRRVGVKNGNGLMAEKGRGHLALIGGIPARARKKGERSNLSTQPPWSIKNPEGSFPSPATEHGRDFLDERGTQDSAPPSIENPDP